MKWIFLTFTLILFVNGCGDPEPKAELKNYVEKIKKIQPGVIEPVPQIIPYKGVVYKSTLLRNPFIAPPPKNNEDVADFGGLRPDKHRRKEALEYYTLDSLKMLGTIEKNNKKWAVISEPDKTVHRITVGNYLGMHHGKVVNLLDDKIEILELVRDLNGRWQEKQATIVLSE